MKWRLDEMTTFLQVVETGSITATARRLQLSKSVVSKRVTDLEAALGVTLLHRSTRQVVPTERGGELAEQVRGLLLRLDEAIEAVADKAGSLRGMLRLTAPMSFATLHLGPILADFARRHPALELAIDLDDRQADLIGGGYDLAVRIGRLADSSLIARRLCTSRRVVCCSPDYARRKDLPRSVEELGRHECIDYAHVHASRLWRFEPAAPGGEPRAVLIRGRICANNGEMMRDAAIAGLGLAILPLFLVAPALRDGRLRVVLPEAAPLPDTVHAVYPPARHVPPKVRALIEHLAAAFAGTPPWEVGLETLISEAAAAP